MSAPVVESISAGSFAVGSTKAIPVPSGIQVNDIIIAGVFTEPVSSTITSFPSEFTLKQTLASPGLYGHSQNIYWKRATGSESGTYSFSHSATPSKVISVWAARISGAILIGDPFGPVNTAVSSSGPTNTTPSVATMTPSSDNCLIIFSAASYATGDIWVPPSGFTQKININEVQFMATLSQTTATPTGSVSLTSPGNNLYMPSALVTYLLPALPIPIVHTFWG